MALSNSERQRRFRENRLKSGERVRLEFMLTKAEAGLFTKLTKRWKTTKAETFVRLCEAFNTSKTSKVSRTASTSSVKSLQARAALLEEVETQLTRTSNLLAWSASSEDSEEDKNLIFRLSDDTSKLLRRIQRRYPNNE
jgi:hypothetical protein